MYTLNKKQKIHFISKNTNKRIAIYQILFILYLRFNHAIFYSIIMINLLFIFIT